MMLYEEPATNRIDQLCEYIRNKDRDQVDSLLKSIPTSSEVLALLSTPDNTYYKATPLHRACEVGDLDLVIMLLRKRAPVDARTATNATPLHYACRVGNVEIVKALLRYKASVEAQNQDSDVPRVVAQRHGFTEIAALLEKVENSSKKTDGGTPSVRSQTGTDWSFSQAPPIPVTMQHHTPTAPRTYGIVGGSTGGGGQVTTPNAPQQNVPMPTTITGSLGSPETWSSDAKDSVLAARAKNLELENARLNARSQDLDRQVQQYRSELSAKDVQLRRMEGEMAHAVEEASMLRAHLSKAESSLTHASLSFQQEQRNLSLERHHNARMAEQVASLERELIELRADAGAQHGLRTELISTQEKLFAAERRVTQAEEHRRNAEDAHRNAVSDMEEVYQLRSLVEHLQQQVAMAEEERNSITVLHDDLALMQEKLQTAEAYAKSVDMAKLQAKLSEVNETRIADLMKQLDAVNQTYSSALKRSAQLESDLAKLSSAHKQTQEEARVEVERLKAQLQTVQIQRTADAEINERTKAMMTELVELRQQSRVWAVEQKSMTMVRKELAELRSKKKEDDEQLLNTLRNRTQGLEREITDLKQAHQTEISQWRQRKNESDEELQKEKTRAELLNKKLKESESQLTLLQARYEGDIKALQQQVAEASNRPPVTNPSDQSSAIIAQLKSENRILQEQLLELSSPSPSTTDADRIKQIAQLQQEISSLKEKLSKTSDQPNNNRQLVETLTSENKLLKSQLENANKTISVLQSTQTTLTTVESENKLLRLQIDSLSKKETTNTNSALLEQQIQNLKLENKSLHNQVEMLMKSASSVATLESENKRLKEESGNAASSSDVVSLQQKLFKAKLEIADLQAKCSDYDAVVSLAANQREPDLATIRSLEGEKGAVKTPATATKMQQHHNNNNTGVGDTTDSSSNGITPMKQTMPAITQQSTTTTNSLQNGPMAVGSHPSITFPTLEVPEIDLVSLEVNGKRLISASRDYKEFYLHQCTLCGVKPSHEVIQKLAAVQASGEPLRVIDISDTYVGRKGVRPIVDLLYIAPDVVSLNLNENRVDSDGIVYLLASATGHPCLQTIGLENNLCAKTGAKALMKLLQTNPKITNISMENSPLLMVSMVNKIKAQARLNAQS